MAQLKELFRAAKNVQTSPAGMRESKQSLAVSPDDFMTMGVFEPSVLPVIESLELPQARPAPRPRPRHRPATPLEEPAPQADAVSLDSLSGLLGPLGTAMAEVSSQAALQPGPVAESVQRLHRSCRRAWSLVALLSVALAGGYLISAEQHYQDELKIHELNAKLEESQYPGGFGAFTDATGLQ